MTNRWWVYQRERFPLAAHAPLIAVFSLSAVGYSALLRGAHLLPDWQAAFVAFLSSFLFFLQLRLADEFKDFEEDSAHRPYRPVPRGLVGLRDLAKVWSGCVVIQVGLALWLSPRLFWLLLVTWAYLALMTKEFFFRAWLRAHPIIYMGSHMIIVPLIAFYATACDWVSAGDRAPGRLAWFLLVSFFNGMVIELGRKIRSPQDEEPGVETYSSLWGRPKAVLTWLGVLIATAFLACVAARQIDYVRPIAALLAALIVISAAVGLAFVRSDEPKRGRWIETMAGTWSLLAYLSLGILPLLLRLRGGLG
jgi:4-hydroxybenzoate polyprenyltransferase